MRRLFLCCAVLVVALTPLACGDDETSSTTSVAPSISTSASTGGDAAALVSTLKASNSTCATVQLYATASIVGGLAVDEESGATNDLLMLLSPALSALTADAAANPADGAPGVVTSAIDRLNTVFSGVVGEMRAAGLTDEQYETLTTVAVEISKNGLRGDTPDDPELKAVLDQVATDLATAAKTALGEGQDDSEAEAWFQSSCPELIGLGGGGGDTSALPSDPCGVISPVAFSAVFPDGVPVGEVTDDANSVCEYRSAEIGGPSVRVAIITPERVRSTAETARSGGSNPVTDLVDIGDEAYLIEGVRIFTNVDGTAGGGGTRGATLGVVAGDVGIWITSTDATAIRQLGIAAVDDLG